MRESASSARKLPLLASKKASQSAWLAPVWTASPVKIWKSGAASHELLLDGGEGRRVVARVAEHREPERRLGPRLRAGRHVVDGAEVPGAADLVVVGRARIQPAHMHLVDARLLRAEQGTAEDESVAGLQRDAAARAVRGAHRGLVGAVDQLGEPRVLSCLPVDGEARRRIAGPADVDVHRGGVGAGAARVHRSVVHAVGQSHGVAAALRLVARQRPARGAAAARRASANSGRAAASSGRAAAAAEPDPGQGKSRCQSQKPRGAHDDLDSISVATV